MLHDLSNAYYTKSRAQFYSKISANRPFGNCAQEPSLQTAVVSPRSSPLKDVPPRETSLSSDERGETSAVHRLPGT